MIVNLQNWLELGKSDLGKQSKTRPFIQGVGKSVSSSLRSKCNGKTALEDQMHKNICLKLGLGKFFLQDTKMLLPVKENIFLCFKINKSIH